MLKTYGKTKSISQLSSNPTAVIKEVNQTGEPIFITNHNNPEAIIMSTREYHAFVEKYNEMEEKLFYRNLKNKMNENVLVQHSSQKPKKNQYTKNPFRLLYDDDELFD